MQWEMLKSAQDTLGSEFVRKREGCHTVRHVGPTRASSRALQKPQIPFCFTNVFKISLGGLGTIVSEILIRSGVGSIFLCDDDKVEISNLHRQFLYQEGDLGEQKIKIAFERLRKINKN